MSGIEDIATAAVDCGFHVHKELGPGLLESVYEAVLARALMERGFAVERQKPIPINFKGLVFSEGFRADLIVETSGCETFRDGVKRVANGHNSFAP